MRTCVFRGFPKTQFVAAKAPFTALRHMLQALRHLIEAFLIKAPLHKLDGIFCRKTFDKLLLLLHPLKILFIRVNIGVIVKHGNVEIVRQILQNIAAAGCAAAMKE